MNRAERDSPEETPQADSPEVMLRIRDGLALVDEVAARTKRKLGSDADYDELVSAGREALLDVARRYNPATGASFSTFAKSRLQGAMIDAHREMSGLPSRRLYERLTAEGLGAGDATSAANRKRLLANQFAKVAAAQEDGVLGQRGLDTLGETIAVSPRSTAEHRSHRQQVIEQCAEMLSPEEATLVRRIYFEEEGLERVAAEIGTSKAGAHRLHNRVLERLRKTFK